MTDPAVSLQTNFSCDLLVVGAGINGAGIARDAAGRGLRVLLCEQHDLASHTSSASSKLIHGGLRYLEHYQFGLVRKSLREREVLIRAAPHLIRPLRFIMPHAPHLRPAWMIRLGLLFYDHLARRRMLAGSSNVDLRTHIAGKALQPGYTRGFCYSDGWADDARLVAMSAKDAAERGATVLTRTRCIGLNREHANWTASLQRADGRKLTVSARAVVNATGPWVVDFLRTTAALKTRHDVRLVQGSHIIVPRCFEQDEAYVFQGVDRRIVFALPYEKKFTLIGTTDVDFSGDPATCGTLPSEIEYLCTAANRYFRNPVSASDVVASYTGVRPLLRDEASNAAAVSRDYALELDTQGAPLLSVFGGKITTFRRLSEEALDLLMAPLGQNATGWTKTATLPGGDFKDGDFSALLDELRSRYAWLPVAVRERYAHAYGTRTVRLLADASQLADLGDEVLPELYAREIDYLCREEWATCAEDILWRRSKLGLHLGPDSGATLDAWLTRRGADSAIA
ncbi:MAG: glycerol-3-phosphate dehydrogenase [Tahibacter sp.]